LDEDALVFGFISLPSKIQVFEDEAPDFGFNSFPSQTQLLGSSIVFAIFSPLVVLKKGMITLINNLPKFSPTNLPDKNPNKPSASLCHVQRLVQQGQALGFSACPFADTQTKAGFGIEFGQHHGGHFVNQAVERK